MNSLKPKIYVIFDGDNLIEKIIEEHTDLLADSGGCSAHDHALATDQVAVEI